MKYAVYFGLHVGLLFSQITKATSSCIPVTGTSKGDQELTIQQDVESNRVSPGGVYKILGTSINDLEVTDTFTGKKKIKISFKSQYWAEDYRLSRLKWSPSFDWVIIEFTSKQDGRPQHFVLNPFRAFRFKKRGDPVDLFNLTDDMYRNQKLEWAHDGRLISAGKNFGFLFVDLNSQNLIVDDESPRGYRPDFRGFRANVSSELLNNFGIDELGRTVVRLRSRGIIEVRDMYDLSLEPKPIDVSDLLKLVEGRSGEIVSSVQFLNPSKPSSKVYVVFEIKGGYVNYGELSGAFTTERSAILEVDTVTLVARNIFKFDRASRSISSRPGQVYQRRNDDLAFPVEELHRNVGYQVSRTALSPDESSILALGPQQQVIFNIPIGR